MKWIDAKIKKPYCYETGHWDGKKSDLFLAETEKGQKFLGCCFEGVIDGNYYFEWYEVNEISGFEGSIVDDVVRWVEID